MIKLTVLYPNSSGVKFNVDYYLNNHMKEAARLLGSSLIKYEVDQGVAGGEPGAPASYVVISNLYFDSVEAFQNALAPHAEKIMGDIPNFSNVNPVIQINQVLK